MPMNSGWRREDIYTGGEIRGEGTERESRGRVRDGKGGGERREVREREGRGEGGRKRGQLTQLY